MKGWQAALFVGAIILAVGWLGGRSLDPLRLAEKSFRDEDYASAAVQYGACVPEIEDPGHAVFNRGVSLYQDGEYDQAAEDFRSVSSGDAARQVRAAYELGNCLVHQAVAARADRAGPLLEEAIERYQSCIDREVAEDSTLRKDAAHNQDIARRLLASLARTPPDAGGQSGEQETAGGDSSKELALAEPERGGTRGLQMSDQEKLDDILGNDAPREDCEH